MQDGKHVILCIDDDPDILSFLKIVLEAENFVMFEAASAEEGLKVYKDANPDLIIVDLMMEEVDAGTSFVKEMKVLGNEVPIYMLSSTGDNLNRMVDYNELGLAGIFQKPIAKDKLLSVIKTKLG
ncbi:MAG: response regulator [bacterium]|nr:response regulator [bacterium]